jgi:hypothetical protein
MAVLAANNWQNFVKAQAMVARLQRTAMMPMHSSGSTGQSDGNGKKMTMAHFAAETNAPHWASVNPSPSSGKEGGDTIRST